MDNLKECIVCKENKLISHFIRNKHLNKKCNDCNSISITELNKIDIKSPDKEPKTLVGRITDLIIPSVDRHDTLFILRTNGTEIMVKHDCGNVISSTYKLYEKDLKDIKNIA